MAACAAWCNEYLCSRPQCRGCTLTNGCHRPPSPPTPPPFAPNLCARTWQSCWSGGQCCTSPNDACMRRKGRIFAMCRPLPATRVCVSNDDWVCPQPGVRINSDGLVVSVIDRFAPSPPPPNPPPPPPCTPQWSRCWPGYGPAEECCGGQLCFRTHGSRFAMCRPSDSLCGDAWYEEAERINELNAEDERNYASIRVEKRKHPFVATPIPTQLDCPGWDARPPSSPSPARPPAAPPRPGLPWPSPPPPPPTPPCSSGGHGAACWDVRKMQPTCCADHWLGCFKRQGKHFA
eukprot:6209933-Prymnesium_polylepis.1